MKCTICGHECGQNSNYCTVCGSRITSMPKGSHWVPAAIMTVLSGIGIWAFYFLT